MIKKSKAFWSGEMKQADRTKMCSNCEANVNVEATYCPFCGADLLTSPLPPKREGLRQDEKFTSQSLQESLASLYKPPYCVRNQRGVGIPDEREESSPFKEVQPHKEDLLFSSYGEVERQEEPKEEKEKERGGGVLPLFLLTVGVQLFILGLFLLFFSKNGTLTLEWNSRFWFFYCFAAIPLLAFGMRLLKMLPKKQST
jgi:hypothetical protein